MKKINVFIIALPLLWVTAALGQVRNHYYGHYSGGSITTGNDNSSFGYASGNRTTTGSNNAFMGGYSGYWNTTGSSNSFFGERSGHMNNTGRSNAFFGKSSGFSNTHGNFNAFFGNYSGYHNTLGSYNALFGFHAGLFNREGNNNTFLGREAGLNNNGSSNVFIGSTAGYHETGSNKLYIDNSSTSAPLVWGDFGTNVLNINGKLGIGTTSPGAALDVRHDGAVIQLGNTSGGGLSGNFRGLKTHWDTDMAFFGLRDYGTDRKDVVINNEQASDNIRLQIGGADKVFVGGNGRVGIGTASPTHPFHVVAVDAVGLFQSTGSQAYLRLSTNEGLENRIEIANRSGGRLALYVPSAGDVLNVLKNGNVGIGTTSPNNQLDVRGQLGVNGRSGNYNWVQWWTDDDADHPAQIWDNERAMRFGTWNSWAGKDGWSEKMRITGSGRVGINTVAPATPLHVEGWSRFGIAGKSNSYLQLEGQDGFHRIAFSRLRFYDWDTGRDMVTFENDNVGIGTTAPAETLHVNGAIRGDQSGGALRIRSAHGYTDVGARNADWAHFVTDRPRFYLNKGLTVDQGLIGSHNEALQLQTAGTTRLTISDTDGDVTIYNNLIVDKTIRFDASTLRPDDSLDKLMVISDDGSMATRSVASIESPWMFGEFFTGRDTLMMICPDSTVVGNITIDVIDLNGNIRIGDNAYLDDDVDYGGINDDWMRFNDHIEFMSAGDQHGIVLYDRDTYLDYTNIYHEGGTTYLANDHGAERYFLKATGRDVAFGGLVTVPDLQVRGLRSDTSLIVTIDEDNTGDSDLFAVRANGTALYRELLTVAESGEVAVPAGSLSVPAGGIGARHAHLADSLTTAGQLRAATAHIARSLTARSLTADNATLAGTLTAGASTLGALSGTTATFTGALTAGTVRAALPATVTVENLVAIDGAGNLQRYDLSNGGLSPWTKTGADLSYTAGAVTTAHLTVGAQADSVTGFRVINAAGGNEVFRIYGDGIVEAKEVLVSLDLWNDHVFYPEYDLMPLEKVEAYVKENHHLPEVPAEKEVLNEGIKLGEMDALLLKKVEELTLYIIAQNKQLKQQAEQLKAQAEQLEALQNPID